MRHGLGAATARKRKWGGSGGIVSQWECSGPPDHNRFNPERSRRRQNGHGSRRGFIKGSGPRRAAWQARWRSGFWFDRNSRRLAGEPREAAPARGIESPLRARRGGEGPSQPVAGQVFYGRYFGKSDCSAVGKSFRTLSNATEPRGRAGARVHRKRRDGGGDFGGGATQRRGSFAADQRSTSFRAVRIRRARLRGDHASRAERRRI